jgi:PAS domain S-box-containing protein
VKLPFFKTIRTHLLILVLISVLPALGIIIYSGIERTSHAIDMAKSEALGVAKTFSYDHQRAVESTRQFLMTLSQVPEIQNIKAPGQNKLLTELLKQNPLYSTLFVVNAEGFVCASAAPLPPTPISVSQRKYFQDTVRSKDFSVGEYAICPAVKRPVLHFAYPIWDAEGLFKGMVGISLDLARYARMFPVNKLPQGTTLSFSDHKGTLLYRYPGKEDNIPKQDLPEIIAFMSTQTKEGVFPHIGADKIKRLNAYETMRLKDNLPPYFFIRVGIPEEKALLPAKRALSLNLLLLGIAFIIAVISAWFLGNAIIVKRLNKLVEASRNLGHGDLKTRTGLDYQRDEMGELAKAFDEMAEALEIKNLERQQAEETIKREINERLRSEEAIKESEQKFRDLVEKSLVGVYLVQDGIFKYVNAKFAEIHDYTVEELIGQETPLSLVFQDDWSLIGEKIKKRNSGEVEFLHYEFRGITKTKKVIVLEVYGSRTIYRGRPAVIGTLLDITDRKQDEEALNNERQRFQALADNAPFGMVLVNDQGEFTYINPQFKEILGYELTDIPDGRTWFKKAYPDPNYRKMVVAKWLSASKDPLPVQKRARIFTVTDKKGTKREISFMSSRLNTGEILMTCEDITTQKRLEAQLLQSQKMEAIGTLAGGIAHDINNLLMTILGYTSLMLMDKSPRDSDYEKLKIIEGQVQSGADLTKQLLGFARGGKYEIKSTNLNELLIRSSEMFGRTKKEISIFLKQEKDLWTVEVDRGQIEQVFLNLFVNAWQAMPAGGELYLETGNIVLDEFYCSPHAMKPGNYVKVSITDTGAGMDEATRQRIFEPFFTTKEMGRGTGLGLASAYGVLKNHGGLINVYSERGKGTTFTLYLPASEKTWIEEKIVPHQVLRGTETILLVDDQDAVLNVGKVLLQKLGYTVTSAKSGEDALILYEQGKEKIDLVILDMVMPIMNGGETYEALRKINPQIKVILSSGYSLNGQAVRIMNNGCNGFIQKPFNISELSNKIREVLD